MFASLFALYLNSALACTSNCNSHQVYTDRRPNPENSDLRLQTHPLSLKTAHADSLLFALNTLNMAIFSLNVTDLLTEDITRVRECRG